MITGTFYTIDDVLEATSATRRQVYYLRGRCRIPQGIQIGGRGLLWSKPEYEEIVRTLNASCN